MSVDELVFPIEAEILPLLDYDTINLTPIMDCLLDEECYYKGCHVPGNIVAGYNQAIGLLSEFDLPYPVILSVVGELNRIIASLINALEKIHAQPLQRIQHYRLGRDYVFTLANQTKRQSRQLPLYQKTFIE